MENNVTEVGINPILLVSLKEIRTQRCRKDKPSKDWEEAAIYKIQGKNKPTSL